MGLRYPIRPLPSPRRQVIQIERVALDVVAGGQVIQSQDHAIHTDEASGCRLRLGQSRQAVLPVFGLECWLVVIPDEPEHQFHGVGVPRRGRSNSDFAERAEGSPLIALPVVSLRHPVHQRSGERDKVVRERRPRSLAGQCEGDASLTTQSP